MPQHCKKCRSDKVESEFKENDKDYKTCTTCRTKRRTGKARGPYKTKLNIDYCQKLAEKKGGKCLSTVYKSRAVFDWECKEGHTFKSQIGSIQKGCWCRQCYLITVQPTIEKMKGYAKSKGGECLSETYSGSKTKLKWKCSKGHIFMQLPKLIYWCPTCSNEDITIEDCKQWIESKGGECLSTEYKSRVKTKWRCAKGHEWSSIFNRGGGMSWCLKCVNIDQSFTLQMCQELAKSKGGKCHSTEYVNGNTKMKWECEKGHIFNTRFLNVKNQKHWCRQCMFEGWKLTIEDCQEWASTYDGKCVSTEYKNIHHKLEWECDKRHRWFATFGSLRSMKSWCPTCSNHESRSESLCREILEEETGFKWGKIHPKWLGRLELDGYCEELNIAFEYQGVQHYRYIPFFHRKGEEDFHKQQERDKRKLELTTKKRIRIIYIPYKYDYRKPEEMRQYLKNQLLSESEPSSI